MPGQLRQRFLQMGTSVIRFRTVTWDIFRGIQPLRLAYPTYVPHAGSSITAWRVSRLLFDSFGADRASTEVELAAILETRRCQHRCPQRWHGLGHLVHRHGGGRWVAKAVPARRVASSGANRDSVERCPRIARLADLGNRKRRLLRPAHPAHLQPGRTRPQAKTQQKISGQLRSEPHPAPPASTASAP